MSTDKIKGMWAVTYDVNELSVMELETLEKQCRKAFTSGDPKVLKLPILSVWETQNEADEDCERLRRFEKILNKEIEGY